MALALLRNLAHMSPRTAARSMVRSAEIEEAVGLIQLALAGRLAEGYQEAIKDAAAVAERRFGCGPRGIADSIRDLAPGAQAADGYAQAREQAADLVEGAVGDPTLEHEMSVDVGLASIPLDVPDLDAIAAAIRAMSPSGQPTTKETTG